jgi:hypothetical protein
VSVRFYSVPIECNRCTSSNKNVKMLVSITVLVIVFGMCEPYFFLLLLCFVSKYVAYLVACTVFYFCLVVTVSSVHSLREYIVSSMPSGIEGGVFTHGSALSASLGNRFRAVNIVWQVSLVGSELQQTAVPGCCDFLRRIRNYRAGKCWNLTGTGTLMCCIFSSCLVWI